MPRVKYLKPKAKFGSGESLQRYEMHFETSGFPKGVETCESINSAKICDDLTSFSMMFCKFRTCYVVARGDYLMDDDEGPPTAYLAWYNAEPHGLKYGKKFYKELEGWLKGKRCISRLVLHALKEAEPFWERMGFEDTWWNEDEGPPPEEWMSHYSDLRTMEKYIGTPPNCLPEKRVGLYEGPLKFSDLYEEIRSGRQRTLLEDYEPQWTPVMERQFRKALRGSGMRRPYAVIGKSFRRME